MTAAVTFSLDLEDHRFDRSGPRRYDSVTRRLADFLDEIGVRGTIFVVGEIAREEPALIRDLAERGHEIAFHSYYHRPLVNETVHQFRTESAAGKSELEDLIGKPVTGFRAPVFSLTRASLWAVDVLHELGFAYSSSVLPAPHPLYGLPDAPSEPFRWPNDLLELPVPLAKFGPWSLPYLGGIYLRYLPRGVIARLRKRAPDRQTLWTYCHPYDFDPEEPYGPIRDAPLWASILLWLNRGNSLAKLEAVLSGSVAPPFAEQIAVGAFADVRRFNPVLPD